MRRQPTNIAVVLEPRKKQLHAIRPSAHMDVEQRSSIRGATRLTIPFYLQLRLLRVRCRPATRKYAQKEGFRSCL